MRAEHPGHRNRREGKSPVKVTTYRAGRRCGVCLNPLSIYNPRGVCGPCRSARMDRGDLAEA